MPNLIQSAGTLGWRRGRKRIRRVRRRRSRYGIRGGLYHRNQVKYNVKAGCTYSNPEGNLFATYCILRDLSTGLALTARSDSVIKVENVVDRAQYLCYNFHATEDAFTGLTPAVFSSGLVAVVHGYRLNVNMCNFLARFQAEYNFIKPKGFVVELEPLYADKFFVPGNGTGSGGTPGDPVELSLRHHLIIHDTLNFEDLTADVNTYDRGLDVDMADPRRRQFTTQKVNFYVPILDRDDSDRITYPAGGVNGFADLKPKMRNNKWRTFAQAQSMFGNFHMISCMVTAGCSQNVPIDFNSLRMFRMKIKLHCDLMRSRLNIAADVFTPSQPTLTG